MPWISNPRIGPPEVHGAYVKLQRFALAHIKLKIASCILQFVYEVYKLYIILYIIVCSNLHGRKKNIDKKYKNFLSHGNLGSFMFYCYMW